MKNSKIKKIEDVWDHCLENQSDLMGPTPSKDQPCSNYPLMELSFDPSIPPLWNALDPSISVQCKIAVQ